jgi:hypothetical protein
VAIEVIQKYLFCVSITSRLKRSSAGKCIYCRYFGNIPYIDYVDVQSYHKVLATAFNTHVTTPILCKKASFCLWSDAQC